MKALLDTNIIINRESHSPINQDIGILFRWLDKLNYEKCVHPKSVEEIQKNSNKKTVDAYEIKLDSYFKLNTTAPLADAVRIVSDREDKSENDRIDSILLNEVLCNRVDILLSEDRKLHHKARLLKISNRVFTINSYLEKIYAENPELVDYKVLSIKKSHFGKLDLKDDFFSTFKDDYIGFEDWFNKKAEEICYVTQNNKNKKILSFLYLKVEDADESYLDIQPIFTRKKRLKIGTMKVVSNGVRLGERFLKIIFDNALKQKVEEIYVTIFDKRDEQKRLIQLFIDWGFTYYGRKENGESVYIRNLEYKINRENPKLTYPFITKKSKIFLVAIKPEFHTDLLPDSILNNESSLNFVENEPYRNSIEKMFISNSMDRNIHKGDTLIFYRTGGLYKSVVTTVGIVSDFIDKIVNYEDLVLKCRGRSVYNNQELKQLWENKNNNLFLVKFLYVYSFPKRVNLKCLISLGIIEDIRSAPRGFKEISIDKFNLILKNTESDENFIID